MARLLVNGKRKTKIMKYSPQEIQSLGKIVVLMGGIAEERSVSLRSGQAVFEALEKAGADVYLADVQSLQDIVEAVNEMDVAFITLHGRWGEDGSVQAILDSLNIVYTGSGIASSALAMDKLRTKWLWKGLGLPTPNFIRVSDYAPFDEANFTLDFPVIVKPIHEGSSIGMRKVDTMPALFDAIDYAKSFDSEVLVEQWIEGREFTCAVLGDKTLPLIELKTDHDFYDFEAKYQSNDTQYICPVDLPEKLQANLSALVLDAFDAVGSQDWGRVDIMLDAQQKPWLIELNSVPGMTDHSLVPMAARAAGVDFTDLILSILFLTNKA